MYAMEINNLSYVYPNGEKALTEISGEIPINSKVIILGSSGSGKSTLARHLSGLTIPQMGSVSVLGQEINSKSKRFLHQRLGFVPQDFQSSFFIRTVWEYVTSELIKKSLPKADMIKLAETALGIVGMLDYKDHSLSYLSTTHKRKIALAKALANQVEILVMDEPVSGLDPSGYSDIVSLLNGLHFMGKTIIVLTHDVDFAASWSERLFLLSEGSFIAAGSPALTIDETLMRKARLRVPVISLPFSRLPELKLENIPRTVDEAVRVLWEIGVNQTSIREAWK
ncbi:ATP-binding cassette domain-containing protein [Paenibacillus sp. Soil787]|uniref:ATP-binding cassette domain-containing protein n=1 Tax=Paenibacillus sp. Soil787 TaxID=1736411 RepID=UPI0006F2422C|nr:ATP-binding cassette domain-containing protein [Paenibacillus sp. Soil787]KRF38622.1 hypothetical protein ASG93_24420 [Paenibacillus sp. Soil787]